MKKFLVASIVLGASAIVSSLIVSNNISLKDEHVIQLSGGAVKLGEVYDEYKIITVKVIFEDKANSDTLINQGNADEYKDALADKFETYAKQINLAKKPDDKEATPESISLTLPAKLEITTAVRYRSEYQPSFTLTLGKKTIDMPVGTVLYSKVTSSVDDYLKELQPEFKSSLYLSK